MEEQLKEPQVVEAEIIESKPINENINSNEEPVSAPEKKKFPGWNDLFVALGIFAFSVIIGSLLLVVLLGGNLADGIPAQYTFITYLVQMLPVIIFIAVRRRSLGLGCGMKLGAGKVNPPLVLWGLLLVLIAGVVIEPLLATMPEESLDALEGAIGSGGWALATTTLCAPILEEILFRGQILGSCRERFGKFCDYLGSLFCTCPFLCTPATCKCLCSRSYSGLYLCSHRLVAGSYHHPCYQ